MIRDLGARNLGGKSKPCSTNLPITFQTGSGGVRLGPQKASDGEDNAPLSGKGTQRWEEKRKTPKGEENNLI